MATKLKRGDIVLVFDGAIEEGQARLVEDRGAWDPVTERHLWRVEFVEEPAQYFDRWINPRDVIK